MVVGRSFILFPQLHHPLAGHANSPWIGNIIYHPKKPLDTPCDKPSEPPEDVKQTVLYNIVVSSRQEGSTKTAIWMYLLNIFRLGLGTESANQNNNDFHASSIEIRYFHPSEAYIEGRYKNSTNFYRAIKKSGPLRKSVYMITGIMIAKGLKVNTATTSSAAASVEAGGTVDPSAQASFGGGFGTAHRQGHNVSFQGAADQEFIVMYEVYKITEKGWASKSHLRSERLTSSHAALDLTSSNVGDGDGWDVQPLGEDELKGEQKDELKDEDKSEPRYGCTEMGGEGEIDLRLWTPVRTP